jgi:small conductance mechanosensitive channel
MGMMEFDLAQIRQAFTPERIYPLFFSLVRIMLILGAALVVTTIINRVVTAFRSRLIGLMKKNDEGAYVELEKRAATIGNILRKSAAVLVWTVAGVMALREIGFDVTPIIAGAGVVGLAVGFGAQNLVRDVITGLFMLMENQIRIGDVVVLNGTGGIVEEINLRTTVLRGVDGAVHIFPNGTVNTLSNLTLTFSYYVFDTGVAYKEDTDRVTQVLRDIADGMRQDPEYGPHILEPLDVLGVDKFADSAVIIKSRLKTRPIKQWVVGREMNRRIKKRFEEEGIEIPFPHRSIQLGELSSVFKLQIDGSTRDQLKEAVREVLAENRAAGTAPQQT